MKRTVFIEILLLVVLGVLLYISINSFIGASRSFIWAKRFSEEAYEEYIIETYRSQAMRLLLFGLLLYLPAALADIAAMVLIAVKEFPVFKPLTDKIAARHAARKDARAAAKTAKAEAEKQKRIEELEAELHNLNKDE